MNENKDIFFDIIVARDKNNGIGRNNQLAWNLPVDLKWFKQITTYGNEDFNPNINVKSKSINNNNFKKNAIIMGRKTWDSLPEKLKPLSNRLNIIISKTLKLNNNQNQKVVKTVENALNIAKNEKCARIFVIGGTLTYMSFAHLNNLRYLYITLVESNFNCDTFFPSVNLKSYEKINAFKATKTIYQGIDNDLEFSIKRYEQV